MMYQFIFSLPDIITDYQTYSVVNVGSLLLYSLAFGTLIGIVYIFKTIIMNTKKE